MGKDLIVYYYPNEKIADQGNYNNKLESYEEQTPEAVEKNKLYWEAENIRVEFSQNMARNWDLNYNDHFSGTCKMLKEVIRNLMQFQNSESSVDSQNSESSQTSNSESEEYITS